MRSVTTNPPTTLADASTIATKPITAVSPSAFGGARDDHRADDHDPVDRVRARHQRRVQHRRHLRDHLEAEEDREHEHRHLERRASRCGSCGHLLPRHARAGDDLVVPVEHELAVRRRAGRAATRRCVRGAGSRASASSTARSSCRRSSRRRRRSPRRARSARSCRRSPRRGRRSPSPARIARTASAGDELRRGAAGNRRGRDHRVERRDPRLQAPPAAPPAARASARARSRLPSPRRCTPTSRNVAPSDSTCSRTAGRTSKPETTAPSRRAVAIACRPATPAPSTSTFAGGIVPGSGHQHRQEPRQPVGCDERGLVAGDGRLRRERVHRLRARDPRDRLERERVHARRREPLDAGGVGQRLQERDQHLAVAEPRSLARRSASRPSTTTSRAQRIADRRAGLGVRLVGEDAALRRRPARRRRRRRPRDGRPSRARARPGARRAPTPLGHRTPHRGAATLPDRRACYDWLA